MFAQDLGWNATNALRRDLALHCLRLDLSFHKLHTPGELIERVDGDVTALANYFSRFVLQILGNCLLIAGILASFSAKICA
jgi:ABC-type multidrug transport system fused ATPase/permease subunit